MAEGSAQIKGLDLTQLATRRIDEERKCSGCDTKNKNQEIENLKRLLANISQRLDGLKTK